jgi:glycosyltransferase involved in cell wall biosynthesis
LQRTLESLFDITSNYELAVIVAHEKDDDGAIDVCKLYDGKVISVNCEKEKQGPAYAWNTALKHAQFYDGYFLASDDIEFTDGWLDEVLRVQAITNKGLIGVNDGTGKFERAGFCTHYFITRDFIRNHNGGVVCCPHYFADFTDVEIIDRARVVNEFAYAEHARIFHHWREIDDEAYKRGDERRTEARGIYLRRKALGFPDDFERIIK